VVLTDADLGLAFIKPRETTRKFDALVLATRAALPQLLDPVIALGRHGASGNRSLTLDVDSIRSIVTGPRPFYTSDSPDSMGCLAIAADGGVLGLYVAKSRQGDAGGTGGSSLGMLANLGGSKGLLMFVIRPVNDIIEIAAQAREARPPAPSVPEATEPVDPPASGP
jgi:hypothetical protein